MTGSPTSLPTAAFSGTNLFVLALANAGGRLFDGYCTAASTIFAVLSNLMGLVRSAYPSRVQVWLPQSLAVPSWNPSLYIATARRQ